MLTRGQSWINWPISQRNRVNMDPKPWSKCKYCFRYCPCKRLLQCPCSALSGTNANLHTSKSAFNRPHTKTPRSTFFVTWKLPTLTIYTNFKNHLSFRPNFLSVLMTPKFSCGKFANVHVITATDDFKQHRPTAFLTTIANWRQSKGSNPN